MQSIAAFLEHSQKELLPYQKETLNAYANHSYGCIEAPTGRGKTLAIALAIIAKSIADKKRPKILWITPMRALARDTLDQLTSIFEFFYPDIAIILRTSDSSSYQKKKARDNKWDILITTPESCALFTTYSDTAATFSGIESIIIDEWHVLLHQKRGILLECFLSWMWHIHPTHRRWALSATLSSSQEAGRVLCPYDKSVVVSDPFKKIITGDILLPQKDDETFRGLGKHLLVPMIEKIKAVTSTIIFTNTRSQSEQWYQRLIDSKQFKKSEIAIHHSAVDHQDRTAAEKGIKKGTIRCIVATSSLDLGVDIEPVDLVIHIGSPKGMARLKQRAGRSGHSPFDQSHVLMVPRHGFEVLESVAAIQHLSDHVYDDIPYYGLPFDVLMQHIINICMGQAFQYTEILEMLRHTYTFKSIEDHDLKWILDFCCNDHTLLKAYPEHTKLNREEDAYQTNLAPLIQKSQRYNVGAITSDDYLKVKTLRNRSLGTIEEQFIRQLNPGDSFLFSGHILTVKRIQNDTVYVQKSNHTLPKFTRWFGGYMSYSSQLSNYLLQELENFHNHIPLPYPLAQQFLEWQHQYSYVPKPNECLIESVTIDGCPTVFLYPFCGRAANHALALSLTHILSDHFKCLSAMTVNDYGIMIQLDQDVPLETFDFTPFLNIDSIKKTSTSSFNKNEMVIQEFRQICLVSGLIYKGMPGRLKTGSYTQSSVRILYDIFKEYDPENCLLKQAIDTVFNTQIFPEKLKNRLEIIGQQIVTQSNKKISPFGYTLYQEQLSAKMSSDER